MQKCKTKLLIVTLLLLAMGAHGYAAETTSTIDDQKDVAVTIYNEDLALVRDLREIALGKGRLQLALREVSARIRPETALLRNLTNPEKLVILEQNFDFDLLSPQKLLEKYVGREIRLVRTHPETGEDRFETATVLAANNGIVLQVGDRIETGVPGRLVYPNVPDNLRDRPTLVVDLINDTAATQALELSYLTGGLGWRADYVAELGPEENSLDLSGWVTLTNQSGTTYQNAMLQLVAGDVNRVMDEMRGRRELLMQSDVAAASAPKFQQESLFEYHLYTLPRPTTIRDNQTKQVALLNAAQVPVNKEFRLQGYPAYYQTRHDGLAQHIKVGVFIEFANEKQSKLGLPLPKGVVRVYKQDTAGRPQFVGEDRIDHTPENETVRLKLGEAFDVTAKRKQTDFRKLGGDSLYNYRFESAFKVVLKNAKDESVKVTVAEPIPGDWKILQESHPHTKESSETALWKIDVPGKSEVVLSYRVEVNF
ncbi:MAG: DUF4139 domain-containing protein [Deltaproteobacteria bacterium]|jgi:hypothetical protein|nr:DUF4139 domain-containing protein [Deltaproteobacteria bacterium]